MFSQILNKHAPLKSKLLRTIHASYILTPLRKGIMKSNYQPQKSIFKKSHRSFLKKLQKQKKTIAGDSTKKERVNFFNNLNTSFMSNNYSEKP